MFKQIVVDDAVTVTIETRNGGRVRLGLDHPVIDLQRCTMDATKALEIAQALLNAGHTSAMVHMHNLSSDGSIASRAAPKRDGSDPAPGKTCADRFECMDKGCQRGNCWGMSFVPLQSATAGDRDTGAGASVEPPQRAWPVPAGQSGRVRWSVVGVVAFNVAVWSAFLALCAVASGWRP